jgi:hypothetical protein
MLGKLAPYAKAVIAGAVAFTGAVAVGFADNSITTGEWWTAAAAGVAALGATFGIPNAKAEIEQVD